MKATLTHVNRFHTWYKQPDGALKGGFFANFVPYNDEFYGMVRHGNAGSNDVLHRVVYDKQLNLKEDKFITKGEDPRCFTYKNTPYVITWSPFKNHGTITMEYKLINLSDLTVKTLQIEKYNTPTTLPTLGKNWMPIVIEDELYFILTIDPVLNILHCNIDTGVCKWVKHNPTSNNEMPFTESRGGTPFIYNKQLDRYIGVGHRTHNPYRHTPYLYTITKNFDNVTIGEDIQTDRTSIEDPLSIFEHNGSIFVCICNWLVPQDGGVDLYKLNINIL